MIRLRLFSVSIVLAACSSLAGCGSGSGQGAMESGDPIPEKAPEVAAMEPCAPEDETCRETRVYDETIGPLSLGMTIDEAVAAMGEAPDPMTEPVLQEANGLWVADVVWPNKGVMVVAEGTSADGPFVVGGIGLQSGATLSTSRGVGLGSSAADVMAAYGPAISPHSGDMSITAGSPYFGIVFSLHNGEVSRIYYGTLAE